MYTPLWFRDICHKNGLDLTDRQMRECEELVRILLAWNKKINLISRTDEENIWSRHLLGSIAFLFRFRFSPRPEGSIVDVGTGGGFPGLPLAILHPELNFTLVDSIRKKIGVVEDIVDQLGLANVQPLWGRAEELAETPEFYQRFDYVVARAVTTTTDLIRWTRPFVAPTDAPSLPVDLPRHERTAIPAGSMVFLKGGVLDSEIKDAVVKTAPRSIRTYGLIVDGTDPSEASDKKVVIVQA
jgi:16S rRNA (guanine527-N7)-methyltransferase